jgi:hypothetical protein
MEELNNQEIILKKGACITRIVDNNHSVNDVTVIGEKFEIDSLVGKAVTCRITEKGEKAFLENDWEYFENARMAAWEGAKWTK